MMMNKSIWKESERSVFFQKKRNSIIFLSKRNLEFLKKNKNQKNNKSRICIHINDKKKIHEMIVFNKKGAYVRPHKHLNKLESFFVIYGEVTLIIFNASGKPLKKIEMGDYSSGKNFYYKMQKNCYHTQIIKKDTIFKEVTNGPFIKNKTFKAEWSPEEHDKVKVRTYLTYLKKYKIK